MMIKILYPFTNFYHEWFVQLCYQSTTNNYLISYEPIYKLVHSNLKSI